jgi:hypothetical protein
VTLRLLLAQERPYRVGSTTYDTAELSGCLNPTGWITFALYGPDDDECLGPPIFTAPPVAVNGNGTYQSEGYRLTRPGRYRWSAQYSGDANNAPLSEDCGIP